MLKNAPITPYVPARGPRPGRGGFMRERWDLCPRRNMPEALSTSAAEALWSSCTRRGAGTSKASHAFWQVDDVEAEVAELKARGVKFEEYDMPGLRKNSIATAGGAKTAWFKDSEGNILAVSQRILLIAGAPLRPRRRSGRSSSALCDLQSSVSHPRGRHRRPW